MNRDLEGVPRFHLQWNVLVSLLHEAALAFQERPEHDVVFLAVETHRQVVAARLQVEKNACALVELTRNELEAHRDLAIVKIIDILGNGIREISERLDVVDELLVTRAIDRTRVLREATCRLTTEPLPSINTKNLCAAVVHD